VYGAVFATGSLLYGRWLPGFAAVVAALVAGVSLFRTLPLVGVTR
jgi:hypothetical protein